jgi:membrane dipeptidase
MGNISFNNPNINQKTRDLMSGSLVWDGHMCMPLRPEDESFLPELKRVRASGCDVVSLNIGFDSIPWKNAIHLISTFRRWIKARPNDFILIENVGDIKRARLQDKLGVMFDLEGGNALGGHLPMVEMYYDLGVRWMLLAYNLNNDLAGGCQENNMGLTDFGREVIHEMERVGMGICCSHISHQSVMETFELVTKPVIFSHSNPKAMCGHYRSISDEAMTGCAKTGGLVGINGIGDLLGNNNASTDNFLRHIDYAVGLIGPDHVGLGTDFVFDEAELMEIIKENPDRFNPDDYSDTFNIVCPEQIPEITEGLLKMNYSEIDVKKIIGENHMRVAREVWKID